MTVYYVDSNSSGGDGLSAESPLATIPVINSGDIINIARGSVFNVYSSINIPSGSAEAITTIQAYGKGSIPVIHSTKSTNVFILSTAYILVDSLKVIGADKAFLSVLTPADTVSSSVIIKNCIAENCFTYGFYTSSSNGTLLNSLGQNIHYINCTGIRCRLANFHCPGNVDNIVYDSCKSYSAGAGWPNFKEVYITTLSSTTKEDISESSWSTYIDSFSNATYMKLTPEVVLSVEVRDHEGNTLGNLTQAAALGTGLSYFEWIQTNGYLYINIGTSSYCGAHGFTTHPNRTSINNNGWINRGSGIWSSPPIYSISPKECFLVDPYSIGTTVRNLYKTSGVQSSPGIGEFGQLGSTLYINAPGFDPSNTVGNVLTYMYGVYGEVTYKDCISIGTVQNDPTHAEGHGFAADDYASNVKYYRCKSFQNTGLGFSSNKGPSNGWYASLASHNAKGGINAPIGRSHELIHTTLVGNSSTNLSLESTKFSVFVNNLIESSVSISKSYSGMPTGADIKFGNTIINPTRSSILSVSNGYLDSTGDNKYSVGYACANLEYFSGINPYIDTVEKYSGKSQNYYTGMDIEGNSFSLLNPSPGCCQWRGRSKVYRSSFLKGALTQPAKSDTPGSIRVDSPFLLNSKQITFEIVYNNSMEDYTLFGSTGNPLIITNGGCSLFNTGAYGPRFSISDGIYVWTAILNIELPSTNYLNQVATKNGGWRHLVVKLDSTQVNPNDRVKGFMNSYNPKNLIYWETRALSDYSSPIYPPNTSAYIPIDTTISCPLIYVGSNHPSSTKTLRGDIALLRIWNFAVSDEECSLLYNKYIRGVKSTPSPNLELLFHPDNYYSNTGSEVLSISSVGTPRFRKVVG